MKSGKYLTILPDQLAKDERENLRIVLNPDGSSFSWIQLVPRYKIDREGDLIQSNAEVFFRVAEKQNEYVHAAETDPQPGKLREINCSLESTSWRLCSFQNCFDAVDDSILLASQLVFIHDPGFYLDISIFCCP